MLPQKVTIRPGDSVAWTPKGLNEVHTVTFPTDLHTDQVPLCENGATDTPAIPTVVPPTGPGDFKCASGPVEIEAGGGNGVSTITKPTTVPDSGVVSGTPTDFHVPTSAFLATWTAHVSCAVAGTYTYLCQIHPGIQGSIVVAAAVATLPPASNVPAATGPGSFPKAVLALGAIGAFSALIGARRKATNS